MCFNFSPLSEMRHSYLRCPTLNSGTVPVYYLLAVFRIAVCSTLNPLLRIDGCPTSYSRVSYSECSTPYKCALLRINTVRNRALYKNPTPVSADIIYRCRHHMLCTSSSVSCSLRGTFLVFFSFAVYENP